MTLTPEASITGRNPQSQAHWDDDEPESLEELRINLHTDRRCGPEDRRDHSESAYYALQEHNHRCGPEDRRAEDPDSARQLRQEVEREYRTEIRQLREEAHEKDRKIDELQTEITQILTWQKVHEPTLSAAIMIVNAGLVFRYLIIGIVGITAAIGGISAMMEVLKSWLQK